MSAADELRAARAAQRQRLLDRRLAPGTLKGTLQNAGWGGRKPLPSSQAATPFTSEGGGACTYINGFPAVSAEAIAGVWSTAVDIDGLIPAEMLAGGVQVAITWVYNLTASSDPVLVRLDSHPAIPIPGFCDWSSTAAKTVPASARDSLVLPYVARCDSTYTVLDLDVTTDEDIAGAFLQVAQLIISPCGDELPIACTV